jgi:hypothetical protein
VVETGTPAGEPPEADATHALPSLRERIADNLTLVIPALGSFVLTSMLAPLQRLGRLWLVVAAVFALGAVLATLALLRYETPPKRLRWLIAGLTACALVTLAVGWILRPPIVDHDRDATLMLVDTSQAMGKPLPGATSKLDAARRSVRMRELGTYEQLGLATYGVGDCGDRSPYRLRMPITEDGRSRVGQAVSDLRPEGRSNLAVAARRVLKELEPFSSDTQRLLIITGAGDGCGGDLGEAIRAAREAKVNVSWDIVGLGLTETLPVEENAAVRVHYASSQAELEEIVRQLLVTDPATREFDKLQNYLDDRVRPEIEGAVATLNARDAAPAEGHLRALTDRFEEGEDRFARDPASARVADCHNVATFEREQFRRLEQALPELSAWAEFEREHPGDLDDKLTGTRQELIDAWNHEIGVYNAELSNLPDLIKDCLAALTRSG